MEETRPTLGQKLLKLIKESPYKNPHSFYQEIEKMSGKDAISQKSLYNIIDGKKNPKETTLFQIAAVLGMQTFELRKGTTSEPPTQGPSQASFSYNESSTLHNLYYGLPFKIQMIELKGADTITKKDLVKIGPNGSSILNKLIKNDILETISSRSVSINGNLNESKTQIKNIAGEDFDKTWAVLQRSLTGKTVEEHEEIEGSNCFKVVVPTKGDVNIIIKHRDGQIERKELKINTAFQFNSGEPHYFENKSKQFSRILILSYKELIKK